MNKQFNQEELEALNKALVKHLEDSKTQTTVPKDIPLQGDTLDFWRLRGINPVGIGAW